MPSSVSLERSSAPSRRADLGFRLLYHRDAVNHCPGCSRTHWYIGRFSAECAFCGTALPLKEVTTGEARPVRGLGGNRVRPAAQWAPIF
jgi:hypothetical protein